jgi:hypothetical protein
LIRWAAVAVAAATVGLAAAEGAVRLNVLLLLTVAGIAAAELIARRRGGPLPVPGVPAGWSRARTVSVAIIIIIGGVTGVFSLFAGLASDPCSTSRCEAPIFRAWLVLLPTQVLIFATALLGAVFIRSSGQKLARAIILGVAGPFLALAAFSYAIYPLQYDSRSTHQYDSSSTQPSIEPCSSHPGAVSCYFVSVTAHGAEQFDGADTLPSQQACPDLLARNASSNDGLLVLDVPVLIPANPGDATGSLQLLLSTYKGPGTYSSEDDSILLTIGSSIYGNGLDLPSTAVRVVVGADGAVSAVFSNLASSADPAMTESGQARFICKSA